MRELWTLLSELGAPLPAFADGDLLRIDGKLHVMEGGAPQLIPGNRRQRRAFLANRRAAK